MLTLMLATGVVGGDAPAPTPTPTPVLNLNTLKQWLRYEPEDGEQDLSLSIALNAAIRWVERHTGLLLTRRAVTQPVRSFTGCVRALWGPNPELTTISYVGSDDTPATIDNARTIITDSLGNGSFYPALGAQWPWGREISVAYMAGYADPDDVPEGLLMAVLLLAGTWDQHREAVSDKAAMEVPFAVASLVDQFRIPVLA